MFHCHFHKGNNFHDLITSEDKKFFQIKSTFKDGILLHFQLLSSPLTRGAKNEKKKVA